MPFTPNVLLMASHMVLLSASQSPLDPLIQLVMVNNLLHRTLPMSEHATMLPSLWMKEECIFQQESTQSHNPGSCLFSRVNGQDGEGHWRRLSQAEDAHTCQHLGLWSRFLLFVGWPRSDLKAKYFRNVEKWSAWVRMRWCQLMKKKPSTFHSPLSCHHRKAVFLNINFQGEDCKLKTAAGLTSCTSLRHFPGWQVSQY